MARLSFLPALLALALTPVLVHAQSRITPDRYADHPIQPSSPSPTTTTDFRILDASEAQPYNADTVVDSSLDFHHTHTQGGQGDGSSTSRHYGYLFTHFTSTDEQVYWHLSDGDDPLNFTPLNHAKPILSSHIGAQAARDSFIAHNPVANRYYLIGNNQSFVHGKLRDYTAAYNQGYDGIVVWGAQDTTLTSWGEPRLLKVAQHDSLHVFAPEAVWVPEQGRFMIHWSGATKSDPVQRIYGAYTRDFKTVSNPFLYYTEGTTGVGDMTILPLSIANNTWVRFWRSDVHGFQVRGQVSVGGVFGSWRDIAPLNMSQSISIDPAQSNQGPLVYKTNNPHKAEYVIWLRTGGGYEAFETEDIRVLPYTAQTAPYFPRDAEQGSVLPLRKEQYRAIKARFFNSDTPGRR